MRHHWGFPPLKPPTGFIAPICLIGTGVCPDDLGDDPAYFTLLRAEGLGCPDKVRTVLVLLIDEGLFEVNQRGRLEHPVGDPRSVLVAGDNVVTHGHLLFFSLD